MAVAGAQGARPGGARLPARARLAVTAGNGLAHLSRLVGLGSGSVVGGHLVLAVDPSALSHLARGRRVMVVSGTNGKTTTTRLLAGALEAAGGTEVVTNLQGANLSTGVAAALAAGRPDLPAVLEVDEMWLDRLVGDLRPEVVVLLNLSRDQLDRNNEVRHVAQRWRQACQALAPGAVVVANADDPLVAWAAMGAGRVVWVGAGLGWRNDAAGCPACGASVAFGEDGHWACGGCGLSRPLPEVRVEGEGRGVAAGVVVRGPDGADSRHPLELELPGRCNRANAAVALAALVACGYDPGPALGAMARVREVAGRYARVEHAGVTARLLLAKNPAGWAEVFDMLAPAPGPVVVAVNARTADGHDPSWLWDVEFERLAGRPVVASGERYLDLSVRLHYAGVGHQGVEGLSAALSAAGGQVVDVVANYTAFHQLLAELRRAGEAGAPGAGGLGAGGPGAGR